MNFKLLQRQQIVPLFTIALLVGLTFVINAHIVYLSPLFLSLVLGLILSNFPSLIASAKGAVDFSAKKLLRKGIDSMYASDNQ